MPAPKPANKSKRISPEVASRTSTGITGVQGPYTRLRTRERRTGIFSSLEVYFQATWQEDGEKRKQSFSVNHYGYNEALKLAKMARKEGRKVVGRAR